MCFQGCIRVTKAECALLFSRILLMDQVIQTGRTASATPTPVAPLRHLLGNPQAHAPGSPVALALSGAPLLPEKVRELACSCLKAGEAAFLKAVIERDRITALDLSDQDIGPDGLATLANVLAQDCTLAKVSLARIKVDQNGANALASALENNTTLAELDLGGGGLEDAGVTVIAKALARTSVTTLRLDGNEITSASAPPLVSLMEKGHVKLLDLSNNFIGPLQQQRLSFEGRRHGLVVRVDGNTPAIRNPEVFKGSTAVAFRDSGVLPATDDEIVSLVFPCRKCTDERALSWFHEALLVKQKIVLCPLQTFQADQLTIIAGWLGCNPPLIKLMLSVSELDRCATAFETALESNTTLRSLSLVGDPELDLEAEHISPWVRKNTTLVELNLSSPSPVSLRDSHFDLANTLDELQKRTQERTRKDIGLDIFASELREAINAHDLPHCFYVLHRNARVITKESASDFDWADVEAVMQQRRRAWVALHRQLMDDQLAENARRADQLVESALAAFQSALPSEVGRIILGEVLQQPGGQPALEVLGEIGGIKRFEAGIAALAELTGVRPEIAEILAREILRRSPTTLLEVIASL
jgi:hypothetical protein